LHVLYYEDNNKGIYLGDTIPITTARKTYTVKGGTLPQGGKQNVSFQLADQIGTVHIKMLGIEKYSFPKLTITNSSGMVQGGYSGSVDLQDLNLWFAREASASWTSDGYTLSIGVVGVTSQQINDGTIILPVWEINHENRTVVPYTGNATVKTGELYISCTSSYGSVMAKYVNTTAIKFTDGNATINFGTQMKKE